MKLKTPTKNTQPPKDRESYDQLKRFSRDHGQLQGASASSLASASSCKREQLSLPKTYTTKRGALVLFSEEAVEEDDSFEDDSFVLSRSRVAAGALETVGDLTQNVLDFGVRVGGPGSENSYIRNFFLGTQRLEKESALLKQKLELTQVNTGLIRD